MQISQGKMEERDWGDTFCCAGAAVVPLSALNAEILSAMLEPDGTRLASASSAFFVGVQGMMMSVVLLLTWYYMQDTRKRPSARSRVHILKEVESESPPLPS